MDKDAIYLEYYPKVSGYVGARLRNRADVEDVVSEVFMRVYAALDRYDENRASLSTWIYTIARNTLINHFAKLNHAPLPLEDYADGLIAKDIDPLLDALAEALTELDGVERDIVILHYYHGLSHMEIAQLTGLSYANTRKKCSLALAELKRKLT